MKKKIIPPNNLKNVRRSAGFTAQQLAEHLGIKREYVSDLENGRYELTVAWAIKISKILNCTPADILGYDNLGISHLKSANEKHNQDISKVKDLEKQMLSNDVQGYKKESLVEKYIKTVEELNDPNNSKYEPVELRLYEQQFACGFGSEVLNYEESTPLPFNKDVLKRLTGTTQNIIAVTASGNSMEPMIKNKDIVFIDTSKIEIPNTKNANKSVFAFRYDGMLHIKYLILDRKTNIITANSFNKEEHTPFDIDLTKYPDFQIIGKVTGSYSKA